MIFPVESAEAMKTGDDMLDEDVPGNSGNSAPSRDDHVKAWQSSSSQSLCHLSTATPRLSPKLLQKARTEKDRRRKSRKKRDRAASFSSGLSTCCRTLAVE